MNALVAPRFLIDLPCGDRSEHFSMIVTMKRCTVKQTISYLVGGSLTLISGGAAAAEAASFREQIEVFLSSGIGTVVSIILFLLFLLWLLLPLAVFGLKTRLREITRETRQANRVLSELQETGKLLAERNDARLLLAEIRACNKILASIRDELTAISEEEVPETGSDQSSRVIEAESTAELYEQIKYDP